MKENALSAEDNFERVLGISFFSGSVADAIKRHCQQGGYVVIPAAPALIKLKYDQAYREAMANADLALADSGLLVTVSRLAVGRRLRRISGVSYFRKLLAQGALPREEESFWIFASNAAKNRAADWLRSHDITIGEANSFVAAERVSSEQDYAVLTRIEENKPRQVVIAMTGGHQEQLARYLRDYLLYRPSIHCIGAALDLLSGEEKPIPAWAERSHLGWLFRFLAQPRMILPRIGIAFALTRMVFKYRSELPPLKKRWADV